MRLVSRRSFIPMQKKIPVKELAVGMFVEDLDRPWIDTPFLIQGFLIEDAEQLDQLRQTCQWVMVNTLRSSGDYFVPPPTPSHLSTSRGAVADGSGPPRDIIIRRTTTGASPRAVAAPSRADKSVTGHERPGRPPRPADRPHFVQYDLGTRSGSTKPPTPRGDDPPPSTASTADRPSLWGQLRDSMSGIFGRSSGESLASNVPPRAGESTLAAAPRRPSFLPSATVLTIYEDCVSVEAESRVAEASFERAEVLLDAVIDDIRAGKSIPVSAVEPVIDDMVESMVRNPDAMMWVAKMRERDANLYAHGLSVAVSLVAFGRHLGYPKAQLSQLGMLGFLLDIGKIKVPRDILEKTGRLSPMEFSIVREHVRLGLEILAQTPTLHPDIVEGIAQHHERLDGTGYPGKLASEGISVFGRMAAIADTFAAMTRERPYADAMSAHEALQKLSNWGGTQFQAEMVDQFIQSIGVFPVGSLVELSSGELAIVVTHNKHKRLRPKVLVVTDADKVAREIPAMLDLIYDVSEKPIYIRRGLAGNAHGIDPREYYLS